MKIFCTGASGYIGGSVAKYFVATGHQVTGLVRSQEKADGVRAIGITPVMGTLDDAAILAEAAQAADAVVNAASADHRGAVDALLGALAGSGKPFIHTSGSSIIGTRAKGERSDAVFDEDTPFTPAPARVARVALNEHILSYRDKGCRPVIICPSLIYGLGLGTEPHSTQMPFLIDLAKKAPQCRACRPRREHLVQRACRRSRHALCACDREGAGGRVLFRGEWREFDARGVPRHQPHARLCRSAVVNDHAGSGERMGRGHRGRHHGLQQPRPRQARAAPNSAGSRRRGG